MIAVIKCQVLINSAVNIVKSKSNDDGIALESSVLSAVGFFV